MCVAYIYIFCNQEKWEQHLLYLKALKQQSHRVREQLKQDMMPSKQSPDSKLLAVSEMMYSKTYCLKHVFLHTRLNYAVLQSEEIISGHICGHFLYIRHCFRCPIILRTTT